MDSFLAGYIALRIIEYFIVKTYYFLIDEK